MGGIKPIMSVNVGRLNFIIKRQRIRFYLKSPSVSYL